MSHQGALAETSLSAQDWNWCKTSNFSYFKVILVEVGSKVVPAAAAAVVEQRSAYDGVNSYDRAMTDEKTAIQSADLIHLCNTSLKSELFRVKSTCWKMFTSWKCAPRKCKVKVKGSVPLSSLQISGPDDRYKYELEGNLIIILLVV